MNTSKSLDEILDTFMVIAHGNLQVGDTEEAEKCKHAAKQAIVEAVEGIYGDSDGLREFASTGSNQVGNRSEWFPVPFPKHSTESVPYVVLSKNRVNNSSVIKGVMALMQYLEDGLYVEMEVNKARNSIKLIPVKQQTAYSRNVLTDFGSHIQIGGGYVLTELGMPFGKYKMVSKRPLILKWAGKPKPQEQVTDLIATDMEPI